VPGLAKGRTFGQNAGEWDAHGGAFGPIPQPTDENMGRIVDVIVDPRRLVLPRL